MSNIKRPLVVGDKVRLCGFSDSGTLVEGLKGHVMLDHVSSGDCIVVKTKPGNYTVYPSQCRRLIKKPHREWTLSGRGYAAISFNEVNIYGPTLGNGECVTVREVRKKK